MLEGLQTLFRSQKVLYVIAGDAVWIRESFDIYYRDLRNTVTSPGQSPGNFFLEKTLQQSISLPPITDEIKRAYRRKLLGGDPPTDKTPVSKEQIEMIENARTEAEINIALQSASTDEQMNVLREKASEKVTSESILKNIEHKLLKYYELLDANPRTMKRIVNNIVLERAALYLSGNHEKITTDTLVKWAILKARYPLIALNIKRNHHLDLHNQYSDPIRYQGVSELVNEIDFDALEALRLWEP